MISRALLNAPFFIPKDADLLRNRKVNTKKRQNRHLPELAFLILGTYFTAPFRYKSDRRGSNPRSRPWQGRALPTTPLSHKRVMGIEPTYPAWKAGVLPLNYTRI